MTEVKVEEGTTLDDIINNLDEEQVEAVITDAKNTIVRANAGSGKTRVLTYHGAYMIWKGHEESKILLLTFTNKAAAEMLSRMKKVLKKDDIGIFGGTFHRVATILLRRYAKEIGYENNFTIVSPQETQTIVGRLRNDAIGGKTTIKESESDLRYPASKVILSYHTHMLNENKKIEQVNSNMFDDERLQFIQKIIDMYTEKKKTMNVMDFDDLLVNLVNILKIPHIKQQINNRFVDILVDEYQDINYLQYKIIKGLNGDKNTLFAVGDPNQSIFGWRGSDIRYINDFQIQFYPALHRYITRNYRSDANILKLAEDAINNNYKYSDDFEENKVIITPMKKAVNKPKFEPYYNADQQAIGIAKKIENYKANGISPSQIAILIRTNYQTRSFEKIFRQLGIPYHLSAGISFYDRTHIRDILAFLTIGANPLDENAFLRVCSLFDNIGEKRALAIYQSFCISGYRFVLKPKLSKAAKESYDKLVALYGTVNKASTVYQKIKEFVSSFYSEYLRNTQPDYDERIKEVAYLMEIAKGYADTASFLNDMVLDNHKKEDKSMSIELTTLHKSKGLEYDVVFIPFLNEYSFPLEMRGKCDYDEERRLWYVGITRAKRFLELSSTEMGSYGKSAVVSQFVTELDPSLYCS